MLNGFTPHPVLATSDLERARAFYEGLGFTGTEETPGGGVMYTAGDGQFHVYPSPFAGTDKATHMGFSLSAADFDHVAAALRERGVALDTFDASGMPGAQWEDDVLTMGDDVKAMWFHDPDGNIIAVSTGQPG